MINTNTPITLLIVEDNAGDYLLLKEYLQQIRLPVDRIVHAVNMQAIPSLVKTNVFDIVFLDLSLPDSTGIDSVIIMDRLLPKTPIIVLSGLSAVEIAVETISLGAQDYLVKGEFDEKLLAKTIQYSIERKRTLEKLHLSNERYEFINKATLDTTWDWDFENNIGQWGEGIIHTFGYSERDLLFNWDIWVKCIHPDDSERVVRNLNYHLDNHLRNWQDEYRFRAANGSYKDVFSRGYLLFYNDGKPSRMYGSTTDVTERKKLEKELAAQQLKQQKIITETTILVQEKERNELGKELHDNINQILATVKIYLGLIKNNKDNFEEKLDKCIEFVNEVIEEIRKLSKSLVSPSLGNSSLKQALADLIHEVNLAGELKMEFHYNIDPGIEMGDKKELMIYRIVQEQINNILRHSHAKNASIDLKAADDHLLLIISDNGIGFNKMERSKGIGLQNISSRVEFYSGKINIFSEPGKGCRFEIMVPLNGE
jgi:two-component system sensor histidine kinase UhpB